MFLYDFLSIFCKFESKFFNINYVIKKKQQYVQFLSLISLILPIYMSNKPLFQYYPFLVPLRMNALLMFMTNMFIVQKLHTLL